MNKSEIATKLKLAIEEKLCSLGAYVDKELPEYILVMIANKKNKDSMEKDLQLFLGQDTTIFIDWLHDLLGKCQENAETAFRSTKDKSVEIIQSTKRSPEKKKKKERSRTKKDRKSDEKKSAKKSTAVKSRKSRSRSLPSKKSKGSPKKDKGLKDTPPMESKETRSSIDKHSKKVNVPQQIDVGEIQKEIITEEAPQMIASTVKVADEQPREIINVKSSVKEKEKEITEPKSNTSRKRDLIQYEFESDSTNSGPRSSVFSRLGKNDLRLTKLTKKTSPESDDKYQVASKRDVPTEKYSLKRKMKNNEDVIKEDVKRILNKEEFEEENFMDEVIDFDKPDMSRDDSLSWFRRPKIQQPSEEKLPNTNFIVTLKGAEKLNLSLKSRLGPKKNIDDIFSSEEIEEEIELKCDDKTVENVLESNEMEEEVIVTAQLGKCKFWPNCKNKESCQFSHPTEVCKNFPICKFGSNCLYIHPDCRFEPNCTKVDCAFTHHQLRAPPVHKPSVVSGLQRCLYYPNCTNVNCKFFHPNIACKFGLACKAKDTCMFYHPTIPHRTEFKWVAATDSTDTTVIKTQPTTEVNVHKLIVTEVQSA